MNLNTVIRLATAGRITATTNGTGVNLSDLTGKAMLVLNASATEGAGMTLNTKLQHSDDNATWVDADVAFNQVTNAVGGALQVIEMDVDGFKRWVRAVDTLGGASPAVTRSVEIIGKKA